jgi:hypothetical protein
VLTNYCEIDWSIVFREQFDQDSGPDCLAKDIHWLFGRRFKFLLPQYTKTQNLDGLEKITFWNTGARGLEVILKMDKMDLEPRKLWRSRLSRNRYWVPLLNKSEIRNFWIYIIYRAGVVSTGECTTTADSRRSRVRARTGGF